MQIRPWACLAALVVASAAITAQGQRPSFKAGVQLVRIDVSVLDDTRQPVKGLQASDFTVLEDGQPRPIRTFEAVDQSAAPATGATASVETATGVATNQVSHDTSRLIFILLDRSIPPEQPMIMARQIADAAVDAMAPGDQAAIVTTGTGTPQNLTSDRARLHETIAASDWSQSLSRTALDDPTLAIIRGAGLLDPSTDGACLCGVCTMDTITQIANQVRDVPRRKLLLLIGSDIIVQDGMTRPGAQRGMSCDKLARDSREKLFDALGTSGLTIHAIDPKGVVNVGPHTDALAVNGVETRTPAGVRQELADRRDELMKAQGNLAVLPALTGGRTILNTNEPFRMMPGVLQESEAYYLLAFEPIESTGSVRHDIEVKVARTGVQVHSVRAIAPPAGRAEAGTTAPASPLERALTELLPDASLPLKMAVATFAGPDRRQAYVGVTIDASSFAAGPGSLPLEIAVQASDEHGRPVAAARQQGIVNVPSSAAAPNGMAAFVELQTYLTLSAGDYELRSAVMNADTRAASSVFTHITVPAFDDGPVALSDLVLGTRENTHALPEGAPALPIAPTTARVFDAGQPAWAFVRAYRRVEAAADRDRTPVRVDVSVVDAGGKRVKHQSLPDASFDGGTADVRLPLPLKGLAPGRYVLRIEATQGRTQASRAVAFEVAQAQPTLTQEHSPALDVALAAAAKYIDDYEHRISAIGAEEAYEQAAQSTNGDVVRRTRVNADAPTATMQRKTRANIMTISLGAQGWVSFRDVFELDGVSVRDRVERLSRILQNVDPESLQQARQIAGESARYNLEPEGTRLDRTINVPMTALYFLRGANQPRSVFRLGKAEHINGVECVTLQFSEQARPRLIRTSDDAAAQGTFWIDMAGGGRVLKSELRMESGAARGQVVRSHTTVSYARIDKLGLWLPTVMDDAYEVPATGQIVTGHATYSDFRAFTVTTSEGIK